MMRIDLDGMEREYANLTCHASSLMRQMLELAEIEDAVRKQKSLQECVPALRKIRENMQVQMDSMKHLARAAEEIVYCCQRAEDKIVQVYEQERVVVPRHNVNIKILDCGRFRNTGVSVRF